jgi:putative CocE/NonD family hydrolase
MDAFPSLHITGWYDLYTLSTVRLFQEMGGREGADAYLIIGPWTHCALDEATAGDVDFGDHAVIHGAVGADYLGMRTQWFSYCAGRSDRFGPRVRFFVMGGGSGGRVRGRLDHGGEWLESDVWPPRGLTEREMWLGARGDLRQEAPEETSVLRYAYDPAEPVPTVGGSVGSYSGILSPGAFDQRADARVFGAKPPYLPLLARPDVLAFSTPPLQEDLVVVGEVLLEMDFCTTTEDTDITVKLVDVSPPSEAQPEGFAMNISDTIVRLRRHEDREVVSVENGVTTHRVRIALPPTANRFAVGHSLRIDVSSSNFPRFDVNGNSSGAPRSRHQVVAINGVRVGGERGARLLLPVLGEEEITASRYRPAGAAGAAVGPVGWHA